MRKSEDGGYVVVGPFILSFGLVASLLKGVFIVAAVLAVPIGLALTAYATYRPMREFHDLGKMNRAHASALATSCGWLFFVVGVLFLFNDQTAGVKIVPWVIGLVLINRPFVWIERHRNEQASSPAPLQDEA